mgnify:CR=1 FL=1
MSTSTKITAGSPFPSLPVATIGADVTDVAAGTGWRLLVVYRGKHCPLCKKYFRTLNGMLGELTGAGVAVFAVSADPKEKAEADVASEGWQFPVGYDLSLDQMRRLGLYISEPRSPQETDRPFAEPGLFLINPDGRVQIVDVSNAPFSRPDLASILAGIKLVQERSYPVRGTMA